jgi:helicase
MVAHTPDMYPRLRPYRREIDDLSVFADEHLEEFMFDAPDEWADRNEYEEFLGEVKSAQVLSAWIQETSEDQIIGRFRVQPGDLYRINEAAHWLLYASQELASLLDHKDLSPKLTELIERTRRGVKAELLPLVRLKGIGRVRARILHDSGLKTVRDLKRAPIEKLMSLTLIGRKLAKDIKEQVGGFVKSEEWEKMKKGEDWEQQDLTEY